MSRVMCHMSHVTCHVSHVTLSMEGLLSTGPTLSSLIWVWWKIKRQGNPVDDQPFLGNYLKIKLFAIPQHFNQFIDAFRFRLSKYHSSLKPCKLPCKILTVYEGDHKDSLGNWKVKRCNTLYYAPCPAQGRSPPKGVNGRGWGGCSYFLCTFDLHI